MYITLTCENGLALEHLAEDAACAPHVDGWCISPELEEQLRRSIPSGHDQAGVFPACLAVALASLWDWFVVVPCETEISYLESAAIVDEKVGCFHVSVQNVIVVEVS
jgi:hypothetical protein